MRSPLTGCTCVASRLMGPGPTRPPLVPGGLFDHLKFVFEVPQAVDTAVSSSYYLLFCLLPTLKICGQSVDNHALGAGVGFVPPSAYKLLIFVQRDVPQRNALERIQHSIEEHFHYLLSMCTVIIITFALVAFIPMSRP